MRTRLGEVLNGLEEVLLKRLSLPALRIRRRRSALKFLFRRLLVRGSAATAAAACCRRAALLARSRCALVSQRRAVELRARLDSLFRARERRCDLEQDDRGESRRLRALSALLRETVRTNQRWRGSERWNGAIEPPVRAGMREAVAEREAVCAPLRDGRWCPRPL